MFSSIVYRIYMMLNNYTLIPVELLLCWFWLRLLLLLDNVNLEGGRMVFSCTLKAIIFLYLSRFELVLCCFLVVLYSFSVLGVSYYCFRCLLFEFIWFEASLFLGTSKIWAAFWLCYVIWACWELVVNVFLAWILNWYDNLNQL